MKKSEAIKIVEESLGISKEYANEILSLFENKIGMLPPTTIGVIPTGKVKEVKHENGAVTFEIGQAIGNINIWDIE